MLCRYCHMNPGAKKNGLWCGFKDTDTGDLVCWQCRRIHYKTKFQNPTLRGHYSETPVSTVQPQLHLKFTF